MVAVLVALIWATILGVATAGNAHASGTLKIGSDLTYPPYAYMQDGKPTGFDPAFMTALSNEIGMTPEFVDTRFEQLITSLRSGHFDVVASALYITPERAKLVDYIAYFTTGNSIVTRSGAPAAADAAALCGHSVAVIKGADVATKLRGEASDACKAAGNMAIDVRDFTADAEGTQALMANQIDAQVTDAAVAKSAVDLNPGKLVISSSGLLFPVPVGIAVTKGNDQLADQLRAGIEKMKADGHYQALLTKYNLNNPNRLRSMQLWVTKRVATAADSASIPGTSCPCSPTRTSGGRRARCWCCPRWRGPYQRSLACWWPSGGNHGRRGCARCSASTCGSSDPCPCWSC